MTRPLLALLSALVLAVVALAGAPAPAQAWDASLLRGAIGSYYTSHPEIRSEFGDPRVPERCGYPEKGCVQDFPHGAITWTPRRGIVLVRGDIHTVWARSIATVGLPLGEQARDVSGVAVQRFTGADLVTSTATGTQPVRGALRNAYRGMGGPANAGAPSAAERAVPGGAAQDFLIAGTGSRYTFTWDRATGATHMVRGGLRSAWSAAPQLGPATSEERGGLVRGGVYQMFHAARGYWSPGTGAHTLRGAILGSWASAGYERGLGYPVTEEYPVAGGVRQRFENGSLTYSTSTRKVTRANTSAPATPSPTTGFDAAARQYALGDALGAVRSVAGTTARTYRNGTVYNCGTHGYVPATTAVARVWEANTSLHGLPVSASRANGSLSTRFAKDSLVLNATTGKVVRNDVTLGAQDALVIGDSQVAATSWVGRAIAANGYRLTVYRSGGIGYVTNNRGNNYGSYGMGVLDNYWALPQGEPGVVYVGGSGNDRGVDSTTVTSRSTAVVRELHRMYPHSRIVMSGVISRSDVFYADRQRVETALAATARATGAAFIPMTGWIDRYGMRGCMYDQYHFNEEGQTRMTEIFTPVLARALR